MQWMVYDGVIRCKLQDLVTMIPEFSIYNGYSAFLQGWRNASIKVTAASIR